MRLSCSISFQSAKWIARLSFFSPTRATTISHALLLLLLLLLPCGPFKCLRFYLYTAVDRYKRSRGFCAAAAGGSLIDEDFPVRRVSGSGAFTCFAPAAAFNSSISSSGLICCCCCYCYTALVGFLFVNLLACLFARERERLLL